MCLLSICICLSDMEPPPLASSSRSCRCATRKIRSCSMSLSSESRRCSAKASRRRVRPDSERASAVSASSARRSWDSMVNGCV